MTIPLRKRVLRMLMIGIFMAMLGCFCGCNKEPNPKMQTPPARIAVLLADMERDGNQIIQKEMERQSKKEHANLTFLDAGNDVKKQEEQIRKVADQDVRAVILQLVDASHGANIIKPLVEKNIKIVALEVLPKDTPVDAYIASNHTLAGQLMVDYITQAVQKKQGLQTEEGQNENKETEISSDAQSKSEETSKGIPPDLQLRNQGPARVILLTGSPQDTAAQEIASAVKDALQDNQWAFLGQEYTHPHIDEVEVSMHVQEALMAQDNGVDAVLATDSNLAMAAAEALQAAGLNHQVLTVGVGANQKASDGLLQGKHDAEVDTRPDLLGQYALDAALGLAQDGHWQYEDKTNNGTYEVPSRIIPVRLIQSKNMYLLKNRWEGIKNTQTKENQEQSGQAEASEQQQGGEQQSKGQGEGEQKKTTLKITTTDGKKTEIQIQGEIQKIESSAGGQEREGGEAQSGEGDTPQ